METITYTGRNHKAFEKSIKEVTGLDVAIHKKTAEKLTFRMFDHDISVNKGNFLMFPPKHLIGECI